MGASGQITYRAEAMRKSIHLLSLVIPLVAWYLERIDTLLCLGLMLGVSIIVDVERFRPGVIGRLIRRHFNFMIREHERDAGNGIGSFTGSTWMLFSAIITFAVFPKEVAVAAFAMLILCDSAAALVGRRFGRIRFGKKRKSVEGSLAFLVVAVAIALMTPGLPVGAGIAGAIAATLAEALLDDIDDNFTVPIAAGLAMIAVLNW